MGRNALLAGGGVIAAAIVFAVARGGSSTPPEPRAPAAPTPATASAAALDARADRPFAAIGDAAARVDFAYLITRADPRETQAAVTSLTAAADGGDASAQVTLGKAYLEGVPGIAKDPARARAFFQRAAAAGSVNGAYYLGVTSQSGEGTSVDPAAAAGWLETAAKGGSPYAMFLLGNAYRSGIGVPRSPAKAIELYERAGGLGHPAALQALSMAYLHGELGLEPDPIESRRYAMEAEHAIGHAPAAP